MPDETHRTKTVAEATTAAPCGLGRRLLVMTYDALAVIALLMAVTALLLLTPLRDQVALKDPLPTLILTLTWFGYLAWCWTRGGLTLGMRAWRVRIVAEAGGLPGLRACLLRFLISILSALALGLGFAWSLFDGRKRTWHDIASRTALVRTAS